MVDHSDNMRNRFNYVTVPSNVDGANNSVTDIMNYHCLYLYLHYEK